jgi:hypothetical protein
MSTKESPRCLRYALTVFLIMCRRKDPKAIKVPRLKLRSKCLVSPRLVRIFRLGAGPPFGMIGLCGMGLVVGCDNVVSAIMCVRDYTCLGKPMD